MVNDMIEMEKKLDKEEEHQIMEQVRLEEQEEEKVDLKML